MISRTPCPCTCSITKVRWVQVLGAKLTFQWVLCSGPPVWFWRITNESLCDLELYVDQNEPQLFCGHIVVWSRRSRTCMSPWGMVLNFTQKESVQAFCILSVLKPRGTERIPTPFSLTMTPRESCPSLLRPVYARLICSLASTEMFSVLPLAVSDLMRGSAPMCSSVICTKSLKIRVLLTPSTSPVSSSLYDPTALMPVTSTELPLPENAWLPWRSSKRHWPALWRGSA